MNSLAERVTEYSKIFQGLSAQDVTRLDFYVSKTARFGLRACHVCVNLLMLSGLKEMFPEEWRERDMDVTICQAWMLFYTDERRDGHTVGPPNGLIKWGRMQNMRLLGQMRSARSIRWQF